MPKTQIEVDDRAAGFIAEQVQAGHFESEQDVVTTAIRLFENNAELYHQKRAEWDAMIAEGLADAAEGNMVDGKTFLQERLDDMKARL